MKHPATGRSIRSPRSGRTTTCSTSEGGRREADGGKVMSGTTTTEPVERAGAPSASRLPPSASGEPILALRGVTMRFGGATALDGVDFELLPGEIHGLV